MLKLKYIGKAWLPGIPARDMTAEEAEKYGGVDYLVETGLYQEIKPKIKKVVKAAGKVVPKKTFTDSVY